MASENPPPKSDAKANAPAKAAWALPLKNLDDRLTRIESKILFGALLAEVLSLALWVILKGLSIDGSDWRSGVIRAACGGAIGAIIGGIVSRKRTNDDPLKSAIPLGGLVVFALLGLLTRKIGAPYFQNWLNWLQNASVLMLVGGIRGLVTRLTLWVALLGASIATGKGKHINIDVVMRFVSPRMRVPVAAIGWLAAALMCITGSWGFVDQLAIAEYRAEATVDCKESKSGCEAPPGGKIAKIRHEFARDLFLVGRQVSLDMSTLPKVVGGTKYDSWLSPQDWNTRIREGGWDAHYEKEKVETLIVPADRTDPKLPAIIIPGGEENASGILVRDLSLVIPMGLLMIALRFIVRTILALTGHIVVDPDAAHAEDDDDKAHDAKPEESEVAS